MVSPGDAFHEQFFALSSDEATSFVADLWRARGWTVERSQGRLVARQADGDPTKTLYVIGAGRDDSPPPDSPAVVQRTEPSRPGRSERVTILQSRDLYEMIQFGVDRDTARELQAAYFDVGPVETATLADAGESPDGKPTAPSTTASQASEADTSTIAGESSWDGLASDASTAETGTPDLSTDATEPVTDGDTGGRFNRRRLIAAGGALLAGVGAVLGAGLETDGDSTAAPPGLTDEGVVDATALGRGHVAAISDRSYSLVFDQIATAADESLRSYISMDLALAADRTYRAHVGTAGPEAPGFLGEPPASAIFWSDGDRFFVQHSPSETESFTEFQPPNNYIATWHYWAGMIPFGGTIGSRPDEYFGTVFGAVPTRLVERQTIEGRTEYRMTNDGPELRKPSPLGEPDVSEVRNVGLDATVDQRGIIRAFDLRFNATMDGDSADFHKTVLYRSIGETDVARPTAIN